MGPRSGPRTEREWRPGAIHSPPFATDHGVFHVKQPPLTATSPPPSGQSDRNDAAESSTTAKLSSRISPPRLPTSVEPLPSSPESAGVFHVKPPGGASRPRSSTSKRTTSAPPPRRREHRAWTRRRRRTRPPPRASGPGEPLLPIAAALATVLGHALPDDQPAISRMPLPPAGRPRRWASRHPTIPTPPSHTTSARESVLASRPASAVAADGSPRSAKRRRRSHPTAEPLPAPGQPRRIPRETTSSTRPLR